MRAVNIITCIIRVDASPDLGYGHFIRCLTLGKELRSVFNILFLVRNKGAAAKVRENGFEVQEISPNIDDEVAIITLSSSNPGAIWIIDLKTQFSRGFLPALKKKASVLLLIENLSFDMVAADGILFPAAHLDEKILDPWLERSERFRVLAGWEWMILRDDLMSLRRVSGDLSLVVTTGGSDPEGVFFKIWDLLEGQKVQALFLIGESFCFRDYLPTEDQYLTIKDYDVKYIARARSVVSTFGSSIGECLYLGKPVISIAHSVENAHGSALLSKRTPACFDVGYYKHVTKEAFISALHTCQKPDKNTLAWLSENPIDGMGAVRVKRWILGRIAQC